MKTLRIAFIGLLLIAMSGLAMAQEYSWQKPHAKVLPTGDLEWAPEPYQFSVEGAPAYIDYEAGNDNNDGLTKDTAWKHHPWDPAATGRAKAGRADVYIFKGGVTYRGNIVVPSGASAKLLRDPEWGEGEARIYGSEIVTQWEKGSHPKMPQEAAIWKASVDYLPRNLWVVAKDGTVTRMKLARTPNWEVSDPNNINSEWWTWDNPEWWKRYQGNDPMVMTVNGKKMHKGVSSKLTGTKDDYEGAVVWSEAGIPTMDIPMPMRIQKFDPQEKAVSLGCPWFDKYHAMVMYKTGHRFYLEDKPQFLDEAGEFWVEKKGSGATIYAWFPGDADPSDYTVEAAKRLHFIDAPAAKNLEVAGLTFRFQNMVWQYAEPHFVDPDLPVVAIRVNGTIENLNVHHNTFEHIGLALMANPTIDKPQGLGSIHFNDNVIRFADLGVMKVESFAGRDIVKNLDRARNHRGIHSIEALRNNYEDVGYRTVRSLYQYGITAGPAEIIHVAGNIANRTARQAIDIYGAKKDGDPRRAPFTRILIHHNRTEDSMLQSSDWGAIENWQGGPAYVYNNVSGNPGGIMNWAYDSKKKEGTPRFAFSYYTDGAQKVYHFNNIAFGKNNEPGSIYANNSAYQSLIGFDNMKLNNTSWRFVNGIRRQGTDGSRMQFYLGNVFADISEYVFLHHTGKTDPNFSHFNNTEGYDYRLMAYRENAFTDPGAGIGIIAEDAKVFTDVGNMSDALKQFNAAAWSVGKEVDSSLLKDPENGDFRPKEAAKATKAVKAFIPWSLRSTVGEWNFIRNNDDPTVVLDQHWLMSEALVDRNLYHYGPRYNLSGEDIGADNFVSGWLEDWTTGSVNFTGDAACLFRLTDSEIKAPVTIPAGTKKKSEPLNFGSGKLPTVEMDTNNFLIETVVKPSRGGGVLAGKSDASSGYTLSLNEAGKVVLSVKSGGQESVVTSAEAVASGKWSHLIGEVDRKAGSLRLYVNGKLAAEADCKLGSKGLGNGGDFIVGQGFAGAMDFLRVARSTLAESETTIQELYEWQFNGPFLKDFTGRTRDFSKSAPGAIDY
ncbi:MAG: LamG domain-containing protein [Candidatus Sumerlaeia bacterium]